MSVCSVTECGKGEQEDRRYTGARAKHGLAAANVLLGSWAYYISVDFTAWPCHTLNTECAEACVGRSTGDARERGDSEGGARSLVREGLQGRPHVLYAFMLGREGPPVLGVLFQVVEGYNAITLHGMAELFGTGREGQS